MAKTVWRRGSRILLGAGVCLGLGCGSAVATKSGDDSEDDDNEETETSYSSASATLDTSTGWDPDTYPGSTGGVGVTSNASSGGEYTTYGSETWGTSYGTYGTTWVDTDSASTGWIVFEPEDCDYLSPLECEGQGSDDFACVLRTGYLLESSASCSFETYTNLCVAIALPQVETCDPLPSCPAQGTEMIWAGDSLWEPMVMVQQGCDEYPTLDYCIANSPDPRCACACAADVATTGG